MTRPLGAASVVAALEARRDEAELVNVRKRLAPDEPAIGMRMRDVFDVAKAHQALGLDEVDRLLDHPAYEPRMAAWCILDFQVRRRIDDDGREERDPAPLFELAASAEPLERRTAITAPLCFVYSGTDADLATGFALAAELADDPEPVVHNAVGTFLKHAGSRNEPALLAFLDEHASSMARPAVRLATAKLDPEIKARLPR